MTSFEKALAYVKKMHRGQYRAGRSPVWTHLLRVSDTLSFVLGATSEGPARERKLIVLSALGHDLIEDTKAKQSEIIRIFTPHGLALIEGMTNRQGDSDHSGYIREMKNADEAVRLIKLADLYDNYASVVHNKTLLKDEWIGSFLLPIVDPMFKAVRTTKFKRYKKTADLLIKMVAQSAQQLNALRKWEK